MQKNCPFAPVRIQYIPPQSYCSIALVPQARLLLPMPQQRRARPIPTQQQYRPICHSRPQQSGEPQTAVRAQVNNANSGVRDKRTTTKGRAFFISPLKRQSSNPIIKVCL